MRSLGKKIVLLLLFTLAATGLMACDWGFLTKATTGSSTTLSESVTDSGTTTSSGTTTTTTTVSVSDSVTVTTTTRTITTITTETATGTTTVTTTTSTTVTTTETAVSLEVVLPAKLSYHLNESLDLSGMVLTYVSGESETVLSEGEYSVDSVDLTTTGTKTVVLRANGLSVSFEITVDNLFDITMAYYESAEGLSGQTLLLKLREIINSGFHGVTYGDARYLLDDTDADPLNPGKVILIYTRESVNGAWDGGTTWDREHVWPQSLLGVSADNNVVNAASDLQNLKPCKPSVNSSRGNKYYDVSTTTVSYFPGNADKGDIARILLYMTVKYSVYSLVNSTPATYQMAKLSVLLQWCEEDPVDDFERSRNEAIYSYQKNRNPFIDYPGFVDLIWG